MLLKHAKAILQETRYLEASKVVAEAEATEANEVEPDEEDKEVE